MFKMKFSFRPTCCAASLLMYCFISPMTVNAEPTVDTTFCNVEGLPSAKRQTVIIIDGSLVAEELEGAKPLTENQNWRGFVTSFVDASQSSAQANLAPRERVTVSISNADGSGLSTLFSGCIPVFSSEEMEELQGKSSMVSTFFGTDWKSKQQKSAESIRRKALLSLVSGVKGLPRGDSESTSFLEGPLVRSLRRAQKLNLAEGIPRIILYTNLSIYDFPRGDQAAIRNAAFADSRLAQIDLGYAELHLLSKAEPEGSNATDYLQAFFLGSRASLETISSISGNLTAISPPADVFVFQGSIDIGQMGRYPVFMRLATDRNGSIVNSWIEEQRSETRFVPFHGILTCSKEGSCSYVGDSNFSQVWSAEPGGPPECPAEMPFGGLRRLDFQLSGGVLAGKISDETCYFVGFEDGVAFSLNLVPNGER